MTPNDPLPRPVLSVVVPAHNEGPCIRDTVLETVAACPAGFSLEVVLVDDASTDDTRVQMSSLSSQSSCTIVVISRSAKGGLGGALMSGFDFATGDVLTWVPGDGEYRLQDFSDGISLLFSNQVVLVKRTSRGQLRRGVISATMHTLIRLLFCLDLRDYCGIFLMRQEHWRNLDIDSSSAFFALDVAITANRKGYSHAWVTAPWIPRKSGTSKVFSPKVFIASFQELLKLRTKHRRIKRLSAPRKPVRDSGGGH